MTRETYTLSEADMNAIYVALKHYNPDNDPEHYEGAVDFGSLQHMELIFETAEAATVTYEGPGDDEDEDEADPCSMCGQPLEDGVPPARDENDNPCHPDCLAVEEALGPVPFTPAAGSTTNTEFMAMRHKATGDVYVLRVEHGGEANGEHSFPSGSMGPFRPNTDIPTLMLFGFTKATFREDAEHLAWLEEEQFERLDLVN